MKTIWLGLFVVAIVGLAIWWPLYKFHDCKRVGHSALYCVMDVGH